MLLQYAKKKLHLELKEKRSLHDVASGVSIETVVQKNLGTFPLERVGSISPDTVFRLRCLLLQMLQDVAKLECRVQL